MFILYLIFITSAKIDSLLFHHGSLVAVWYVFHNPSNSSTNTAPACIKLFVSLILFVFILQSKYQPFELQIVIFRCLPLSKMAISFFHCWIRCLSFARSLSFCLHLHLNCCNEFIDFPIFIGSIWRFYVTSFACLNFNFFKYASLF